MEPCEILIWGCFLGESKNLFKGIFETHVYPCVQQYIYLCDPGGGGALKNILLVFYRILNHLAYMQSLHCSVGTFNCTLSHPPCMTTKMNTVPIALQGIREHFDQLIESQSFRCYSADVAFITCYMMPEQWILACMVRSH